MKRALVPGVVTAFVALASTAFAQEPAPAAGAPPAAVRLPATEELVLPCGMRVFLVPDHETPLVALRVRLPGGGNQDTPALAGRAALVADWLRRGAGERDTLAFRRAVEDAGGVFDTYATARWIGIDAEFLAEDAPLAVSLLADVLLRPRLDAAEFAKSRDLALEQINVLRTEPNAALGNYWNAWLFGAHPWGNPAGGDEASLGGDPDALRAAATEFARETTRAGNVWLAVAGDFDSVALRALLTEAFPGTGEPLPPPPVPAVPQPRKGGVLLVDEPDSLQTYFTCGGPGFDRTDPDHAARHLANTILGGRFTSRLNRALRTEAGLTYGAFSRFDDVRGGAFWMHTFTQRARTAECVGMARRIYREFVEKGMTADELASARTYVKGQFAPDELETAAQSADWVLDLAISGLSRDFIDGWFARLDAVTLDDVNRVIRERFPREPLAWAFIGPAAVVRPIAEGLGEVTQIELSAPGFGPR